MDVTIPYSSLDKQTQLVRESHLTSTKLRQIPYADSGGCWEGPAVIANQCQIGQSNKVRITERFKPPIEWDELRRSQQPAWRFGFIN